MKVALAGPVQFYELVDLLDEAPPPMAEAFGGRSPISALARGLHERGHEVSVTTLAYGVDRTVTVSGPRFEVRIVRSRDRHRARDVFAEERRGLLASLERTTPDVVHAHWTYEFALAALAADAPAVVTVHDWAPTILRHHRHPYRVVRLGMAFNVLRRAQVLTAPSPYLLERVRRWSGGSVHLVPNAIADDDFVTTLPPRPETDTAVLVAINNGWGRRKNVDALLRAFPSVVSRVPGARLRLIGSGYERGGSAHRFATREGLDAGVDFVGELPYRSAMDTLAGSGVFVHPSREESFGLVLLEAMARGIPVVAGERSGAVPWVCDEGRAGELVDVEQPAAIADAVVRVLVDHDHAQRLRAHALRWARDRFSMSAVVRSYEQLYAAVRVGS